MLRDGPLVVLLGEHATDQANDGGAARKDADDIGAPADLFVQSLLRVVGPDLAPVLLWKGGEGKTGNRVTDVPARRSRIGPRSAASTFSPPAMDT